MPVPENTTIVPITSPWEIHTKRLYLPFVITGTCPDCGERVTYDAGDYMMYPMVNKPMDFRMFHEHDDGSECEWSVSIVMRITAELVETDGSG